MNVEERNKDYDRSRPFRVESPFEPTGDQPAAIDSLAHIRWPN